MLNAILVSGPPFDAPLWTHVVSRLNDHGIRANAWPMFRGESGTFSEECRTLAEFIENLDGRTILVSHGLANPLAMAVSNTVDLAGLVLSNGPLSGPDRFTKAVRLLLRAPGAVSLPFLTSSLGLRRMVVNPYVMDRDTTVAVCAPILTEPGRRARMQEFLQTVEWNPPKQSLPTLLCQGDSDLLSCQKQTSFIESNGALLTVDPVPGGRPLHPLERPWELADRLFAWSQKIPTATSMS